MDAGLLFIRIVFGALMVGHGCQKLFGWFRGYGLEGTGGFFESIGFRPGRSFAAAVGTTECTAGLLFAAGLLQPVASMLIITVVTAAILSVHIRNGVFATSNGVELPLLYAVVALFVAVTGPGVYSIDARLGLTSWWTPLLTDIFLAVGVLSALVNVMLRRSTLTAAHA